jgi:hypothetical protein
MTVDISLNFIQPYMIGFGTRYHYTGTRCAPLNSRMVGSVMLRADAGPQ